jgi:hypothetical protein
MPEHFDQFIQKQESPGLLLVHSQQPIGSVIEKSLLVWVTWTEEDLHKRAHGLRWQRDSFGRPESLNQRGRLPQTLRRVA